MANRDFDLLRNFNIFVAAKRATKKRKFIWIAVCFALLLFFLFVFGGNYGVINMFKLAKEKKTLQNEIKTLEAEKAALESQAEKLKNDKGEIERIAREKYGMAKKGEKVIKFIGPEKKEKK